LFQQVSPNQKPHPTPHVIHASNVALAKSAINVTHAINHLQQQKITKTAVAVTVIAAITTIKNKSHG
jgi:hypothetical protein